MGHDAIGGLASMGRQDLAAADLASWGECEPGREMLGSGPAAQIGTAFCDQPQRQAGTDSVDLCQIGSGQGIQRSAHVKAQGIALLGAVARFAERCLRWCLVGSQGRQSTCDVRIAFIDARLVEVVERQCLLQGEDVLGLIVAGQRCTYRLDSRLAVAIPHRRQNGGIAFSTDDGADDPHARGAGDVSDDMMQLHVHEGQCLLHVLDMGGGLV